MKFHKNYIFNCLGSSYDIHTTSMHIHQHFNKSSAYIAFNKAVRDSCGESQAMLAVLNSKLFKEHLVCHDPIPSSLQVCLLYTIVVSWLLNLEYTIGFYNITVRQDYDPNEIYFYGFKGSLLQREYLKTHSNASD